MALITLNTDPSPRDLRLFGLLLPPFVAVAGLVVAARAHSSFAAGMVWRVGAALSVVYLVVPSARRAIFVGWSYVTYPIGWAISTAVMAAVFFAVITPIGLLARLLRHDPLGRRARRPAGSYWERREPERDVESYFRQF